MFFSEVVLLLRNELIYVATVTISKNVKKYATVNRIGPDKDPTQ